MNNITKQGIWHNPIFLEKGYQFNTSSGWTYTPAVDTVNSTISSLYIDLSSIQPLEQTIKLKIELDLTWGDFTGSGTAGTFRFVFQGANRLIGATSNEWQGQNYITSALNSAQAPLTLCNNNITGGTYHYSTNVTIPAAWFATYEGSILGFKVDYRRGTGNVSISNLNITLDTTEDIAVVSLNDNYIIGGQIYEY